MFVIDDLVREFLSYMKEARLRDRDAKRTAILKAHNAVADLAKVFSTVETDMRREILRLTEKRNDPDGFEQQLQAMLFHDSFWYYTNSSFCRDLRAARAEFRALKVDDLPTEKLVWYLERHRLGLISQVQHLLFECRDKTSDHDTVIRNLCQALDAVASIRAEVDEALDNPLLLGIPDERRHELDQVRSPLDHEHD